MSRGGAASIPAGSAESWKIVERTGSVRALHETAIPSRPRRELWIMRPESAAIVLGSGQPVAAVDAAEARRRQLPVLRRRSGGGAVMVSRADLLWIDVLVPRDDPLWDPDVARAFDWLGRAWQQALATCGIGGEVYAGRLDPGRWGSLVCFAGRGPGEVFVGGRKVIGLSQRRTRACARFQAGLLRRWEPAEFAGLLAVPEPEREALVADLGACAQAVPVSEDRLIEVFAATLRLAGR